MINFDKYGFREVQNQAWQNAEDHGWHPQVKGLEAIVDPTMREVTEASVSIALVHAELSEAIECLRNPKMEINKCYMEVDEELVEYAVTPGQPLPKPEGFGSEIADVFIRCWDIAKHHGVNLADEIERKMLYNQSRPFRHGGKRA